MNPTLCKNCGMEIHPITPKFATHVHTGKTVCRKQDLVAHRGTKQSATFFAEPE